MASIQNNSSLSTPPLSGIGLGSFKLEGEYVPIEEMPHSLQKILLNTEKVVIIREEQKAEGGLRTTGTMWYKKQVLGFTVEDHVRDIKIYGETAIPDTIIDPKNISTALPEHSYNITLGGSANDFITPVLYEGQVLRISSASDEKHVGTIIYTKDVFHPDQDPVAIEKFISHPSTRFDKEGKPREDFLGSSVAFSGVLIHHGHSEGFSAGCIIFGNKRSNDGKLLSSKDNYKNIPYNKALNKYLQEQKVVVKGKRQQLLIINLWEVPKDRKEAFGEIIDGETGKIIPGTEVKPIKLPIVSPGKLERPEEEITLEKIIKDTNPLSSDALKSAKSSFFNALKNF